MPIWWKSAPAKRLAGCICTTPAKTVATPTFSSARTTAPSARPSRVSTTSSRASSGRTTRSQRVRPSCARTATCAPTAITRIGILGKTTDKQEHTRSGKPAIGHARRRYYQHREVRVRTNQGLPDAQLARQAPVHLDSVLPGAAERSPRRRGGRLAQQDFLGRQPSGDEPSTEGISRQGRSGLHRSTV